MVKREAEETRMLDGVSWFVNGIMPDDEESEDELDPYGCPDECSEKERRKARTYSPHTRRSADNRS